MNQTVKLDRKGYIDIAKGLLIILVVVGHSKIENFDYIYWFHMPAFFIISGFLFKPFQLTEIKAWLNKTFSRFLIPYIAFYIISWLLLTMLNYDKITFKSIIKDFIMFVYGGRAIGGVYWYVTCLIVTQLIFSILQVKLKKKYVLICLVTAYIIGHLESIYILPSSDYYNMPMRFKFPWNIDVSLVALIYFGIGFYCKDLINSIYTKPKVLMTTLTGLGCSVLIIISELGILKYSLDMKYSQYRHLLLDLCIPVLFTVFVLLISMLMDKRSNLVGYIGKQSLIIMYLHLPINTVLQSIFHYNSYMFILVGIVFPLICSIIFEKNPITENILLGKVTIVKAQ
ncbi:O-acetyltransferase [Clostridium polyendosporum]|uniref:O-acetyltransferase n=1 Tax=Clostridium polyendosporum TaxID=69208 RepID=A0A919S186_9CLOT|nr:acyltransferase family protein [Clostridium polyendosporum]GIM30252.1 O-acetyltransferase [Clostridium polyendosporum]